MKNIFLLGVFVFCLFIVNVSNAQNARVYGRVFMPVEKKSSRTFRGRIYRNRLAQQKLKKEEENDHSVFEDIVIAAYPLSFDTVATPLNKAYVLQKNATFIPNVLPVTPGTQVKFVNLDKFYHNVFSITPGAKFNIGRRPTGTVVSENINKLGAVKLFCDIHSQMNATILTVNTPFFTQANRNGKYELNNLPAGKYRIEVIHPDFDTQSSVVTLKRNDQTEQSFTLTN